MPVFGSRRARAERPRARRTPFEGGADPRARRSPLEVSAPLERGGARPREARILERDEACSRGSSSGPPWWAVGAPAAWVVSCMVKRGVFGFRLSRVLMWGLPSCLRGPLGLSPTQSVLVAPHQAGESMTIAGEPLRP
jgi:hypothetical protein